MRDINTPCGRKHVFFEKLFIHASEAVLNIEVLIV